MAARRESLRIVRKALRENSTQFRQATLTAREMHVFKRRDEEASFLDIGTELGVTPERVRQIQSAALRKLREAKREK